MNHLIFFAHAGHEAHTENIPDVPVATELKWWAIGIVTALILTAIAYVVFRIFQQRIIRLVLKAAKPIVKNQHKIIHAVYRLLLPTLLVVGLGLLLTVIVISYDGNLAILNPHGTIAEAQLKLITFTALLSLIVVIPVFSLTFFIVWKFRASNKKARYTPDWDHSRTLETIWWLVPLLLIAILGVVIWKSSHELDPYRKITSDKPPLTVQVVALDWKWLFIYPEQHIATVNYLELPKDRPVNFVITSDAPMNSFWIPQLGGQVYAMPGMETQLHLLPDAIGEYQGVSANISGEGFAGMRFTAKVTDQEGFEGWVDLARRSTERLDTAAYNELAEPSQDNSPTTYALPSNALYDTVLLKYMQPGSDGMSMRTNDKGHHE